MNGYKQTNKPRFFFFFLNLNNIYILERERQTDRERQRQTDRQTETDRNTVMSQRSQRTVGIYCTQMSARRL